jgi:L-2-hydroxyglutarate oxidase
MIYDYIIIGGGIVGASTAWQLQQRQPGAKTILLEKESALARHQTGRNSGVVHAGVYYAPGSLKARFCKAGAAATIEFCKENDIAYDQCGKLLVATSELELERMDALYLRCLDNGLDVELLPRDQLRDMEPEIAGLGAIHSKSTAIVDFREVCRVMVNKYLQSGGEARFSAEVLELHEGRDHVTVVTDGEELRGKFLVACGGTMADRIARMMGIDIDFQIIPFRGEYYRLSEINQPLVRRLIYPIPDPSLPFLGVHLTRMIDGTVTVGPNAVQGWKREGYGTFNFSARDTWQMLRFPGFWKVIRSHFRTGAQELKDSVWRPGYLKRVQKYCPRLSLADLEPYPVGIRAQAVLRDGSLVHDFLFAESARSLHVCNAPSPAATSAIPIGAYICDRLGVRIS